MTIHQPRYSIYKLFDTLTLLSMGQMIYHGAMNNCLDYFSTLGEKYTTVHVQKFDYDILLYNNFNRLQM